MRAIDRKFLAFMREIGACYDALRLIDVRCIPLLQSGIIMLLLKDGELHRKLVTGLYLVVS
jgi:hypothetical protein